MAEVSREIGVGQALLGRWVKQEREHNNSSGERTYAELEAENSRLKKELASIKLDNEFLSKASAFFAAKQHEKRNTN
ncbi:transposase [Arcanobacterium phocisimile]|uniref:Transposase n=1 Tax=Arcanobacterium phocisimile TaxID=1302235 RepID=A0ABX7ILK6_9ACTO|nr:transposase [Arcanobacterium phocisimile]